MFRLVQIFTLPLMTLGAVLLLRSRRWGYALAGAPLMGKPPAGSEVRNGLASAALTPVFAVLPMIGVVVLGIVLRPGLARVKPINGQERKR